MAEPAIIQQCPLLALRYLAIDDNFFSINVPFRFILTFVTLRIINLYYITDDLLNVSFLISFHGIIHDLLAD